MVETDVSTLVGRVQSAFAWAPPWLPAIVLMAALVVIVTLLHRWIIRALHRLAGEARPLLHLLITRLRGPTLLAILLLVLAPVVPAAGLSDTLTAALVRVLLIGFVLVLGWSVAVGVELAAEAYIRRLPQTVEEADVSRRAHLTQIRVLGRAANVMIALITLGAALMTVPAVRQFGVSLFASAGAAGLVVGLAARPLLANLIAGMQIALTQPIRLEDALILEGEWGWVEEITTTYVVLRLWDLRRMIVPLAYFMEKPFQNWTHGSPSLIGTVMFYVDWSVPVDRVRAKLQELVRASALWDGKTVVLQVTDVTKHGVIELRALASASNASRAWDLRCELREGVVAFLQQEYPEALPKLRLAGAADDRLPRGSGTTTSSPP
ncbi:MAG: mechanosensitive ion channel family protein [Alphaproteobacteria bacterium]|nr:mechanosensitive ion channel family protein [Alphaproteobacteria bacterium]